MQAFQPRRHTMHYRMRTRANQTGKTIGRLWCNRQRWGKAAELTERFLIVLN